MDLRLLFLVVCMLANLLPAMQAQQNETSNRRRSSVSPEEIIAWAWLAQGDHDNNKKLNKSEINSLIKSWSGMLSEGGSRHISQTEFLNNIPTLLTVGTEDRPPSSRSMLPNHFLGFFVALDSNKDGSLTPDEFSEQLSKWFKSWQSNAPSDQLDTAQLSNGLQQVLPKTNMTGATKSNSQSRRKDLPEPPPSPVLSPAQSLSTMALAPPFEIQLAASEPMIQEPVAMSFDADGAAYVVEMRSFMLDVHRTGERDPIGRITKLIDDNGDGIMDRSTVFLDGLIVPRAVLAIYGGILFVEDYTLQFAKDTDGNNHADIRLLIDSNYGRSNIEHAPNGLMLAMDNWIYNGRSPWRYRLVDGKWVKERTEQRGQWGMTQDVHGRLLYNVNNSQLLGDFAPPNTMGRNQHYPSTAGLNLFIATDQTVFTTRMNTAVNRGYLPDVLDDRGHLHVFASSCSPLIYRGDQFHPTFVGNAFVCDPAANIVKRNIVSESALNLTAKQAYKDREFIASTDERFRPVNIYNGPDGALWVLDMYRGIAQYGMFMTDYLRKETLSRGLDKGTHLGRIYRIIDPNRPVRRPSKLSKMSQEKWVELLNHPDGWIRDTVQRLLVEKRDRTVIPRLQKLIEASMHPVSIEHALWTLEGLLTSLKIDNPMLRRVAIVKQIESPRDLEPLSFSENVWQTILQATDHSDAHVQVAAMRVAESLCRHSSGRSTSLLKQLESKVSSTDQNVLFQMALTASSMPQPNSLPIMSQIATKHSDAYLIREAILSGLEDWEFSFIQLLYSHPDWMDEKPGYALLSQSLSKAITASRNPTQFDLLLELASNQTEAHAWKSSAILTGIRHQLVSTLDGPFILNRKPASWDRLNKNPSISMRQTLEHIQHHLVWPGHEGYEAAVVSRKQKEEEKPPKMETSKGEQLYQMICAGCHGISGEGIQAQAPPLRRSQWSTGSPERLIRIVLQGAQGPIQVADKRYTPPEILAVMPPVAALEDEQLADILTYIRQAWGHDAQPIKTSTIAKIRQQTQHRQDPWTESELLQIP